MTTKTYDKDLPKGFIPDEEEEDDDLPAGFVPDDDKKKRSDGGTASGTGSAGKSKSSADVAAEVFSYKRQVAREPMPANPAAARQKEAQLAAASNVLNQASLGNVKPEELSEVFNSIYGKGAIEGVVSSWIGDDPEYKSGKISEEKWKQVADNINEQNVGNRKEFENNSIASNDNFINDALVNFKAGVGIVRTPETHAVKTTSISVMNSEPLKNTDINDPKQLGELYEQLEKSNFVVGKDGEGDVQRREQLMQAILEKQKYLVSKRGVDPEVGALNNRIGDAVARANRERELGENIDRSEDSDWLKNDEINSHHFQLGLSMLKDLKPGRYENIIRGINERGKIAKNDYTEIASIGQEINNIQTFRGAADDPSLIGKETSLDYSTDETRKMEYARIIGERAKQQGIRGREFSEETIFKLGYDLPNKTTLKVLADEDAILGYDAIPKSGVVESFVRGVQLPFAGIESTLRSFTESPAETYLRSRRTDVGVGGQKVADKKGQLAANLPSERGNIFLDAVNGFGQFVPQILLTKGVGGVLNKALGTTGTALARGVTNYGGTAISTYFQTYGDAYADALDKTGDVATAKLMGNIGAVSAAGFELLLPDVKIADKAFSGLQKTLAKDLMDIVRKGGDLDALAKAGRPAVQKFVKEALNITGQEVAEEVGTQLVDFITESIFSPRTAKDRDLSEELMETAKATAVSMSIPAIFGGAGVAMRKDFTENAFHAAAINFNEYASALKKQYQNGNISKEEHDKALTLLSTHKQSLDTKPTEDANGKRLNGQQQLDYALEETKIKTNKEKEKNVSGVQKEVFEGKIKQSEDIQRGILMPEPKQRRAVQAETDNWKQNIAAIEDRTDITPEQKETLKQAEDARHAQAISSLINKPKTQSDANVQKDQKRDGEAEDTQKVQRQADGKSDKDSQIRQEKVKTEGAAVAAAAPSFDKEIAELQKNRQLDNDDIDRQIDEVKGFAPSATKDIQIRNLEQARKEQNDYYDSRIKEIENKSKTPTTEDVVPSLKEFEDKKADIEKMWREELEANPVPDLTEDSSSYDERSKVYDKRKDINEKYKAQLAALEKTKPEQTKVSPTPQSQKEDVVPSLKDKSDAEIENRMTELGSGKEFNELEKEMEARERDSVFKVPLSEAESAVDNLLKKEKEQPNGWGAFIDKKDAAQTKQVIRDYSNPKELSDALIKKDFKDALMGEPATWYADGMKLRESMKEAANRGIDIDTLLKEVEGVYIKDGVDQQTAKQIIARKLQSVYEGSTKVSPTQQSQKGDVVPSLKDVDVNKLSEQEKPIFEKLSSSNLTEQVEIDQKLHDDIVGTGRFSKADEQNLIDDKADKELVKGIFNGEITDAESINKAISAIERDKKIHNEYLGRRQSGNTGTHEWHRMWANVYDGWLKKLNEVKQQTKVSPTTVSDEPLNEQELAAVVGLSEKEFSGEGTFMKPAIDVLKDDRATSQQKRQALKDISDQLLAPITEATTGELLGKEADLIYDLGYEAPKENEALKEIEQTTTKKVTPIVLEAVRINNQGEINRLVKIVTDGGGKAGVAGIAEQYNKDIEEGKETEITRSVDKLLESAKEAAGITTTQPKQTKKRPTTKAEIDALPDDQKDAAIDALIYGDEQGEQAPDETNPKTAVKIEAIPANGTVESTLKLIADTDNEFSDLAKEILRTTDKKSLQVPIKVQRRPGARSVYQTSRDQIIIDPSSKQDARVIMHEIVHGTTSRKIDNALKNPSHGNSYGKAYLKALQDYLKNPLGRPEIKRLVNLYLKAAKELGYEKQLFEGGAVSKRYQGRTMQTGSGLFLPGGTQADANRVKNTIKDIVGEENVRVWNNGYGYWQVNVTGDGIAKLKASPIYSEKVETWEVAEGGQTTKQQRKSGYVTFEYDKKQNATAGNADLTVERGLPYGMGNLDEFLAEAFSNPAFQQKLASIKDENGVSLWQKFIDAINKIISAAVKLPVDKNYATNTLLESVIKNGAEIIARERDASMQLSLDLQSPVNVEAAKQRMRDAGYSENEIKAEFEKRGLAYKEKKELSKADADKIKGIEDQRQKELSDLLKPTVNITIDDIDPDKVAQHEDAFALKDEILKLDDEISELKQLVNCVYG